MRSSLKQRSTDKCSNLCHMGYIRVRAEACVDHSDLDAATKLIDPIGITPIILCHQDGLDNLQGGRGGQSIGSSVAVPLATMGQ